PSGVLTALHDTHIGKALVALHQDTSAPWTLEMLAEKALMSRSAFALRFRELVGMPPMAYLQQWRVQVAYPRLQAGESVKKVAAAVGYRSEAAFSRVFTRLTGRTPGEVRKESRRPPETTPILQKQASP